MELALRVTTQQEVLNFSGVSDLKFDEVSKSYVVIFANGNTIVVPQSTVRYIETAKVNRPDDGQPLVLTEKDLTE